MDLRKAREDANLPRWKAAQELGTSEDTIKRWEDPTEKAMPTSADVNRMESVYNAPGLWYAWMYSSDEGFRDHMTPPSDIDLKASVLALLAETTTLIDQQARIMKDASDGRIDNEEDRRQLLAKGRDIAQAALSFCAAIREQIKTHMK